QVQESKGFFTQDNLALDMCHRAGIQTGIISGRTSIAVEELAKRFKLSFLYQGNLNKTQAFAEIKEKTGFKNEEIAYMGDDLPDAILIKQVGLGVATANAREELKAIANYTTSQAGGEGAVRELVEIILKAQNRWAETLAHYKLD